MHVLGKLNDSRKQSRSEESRGEEKGLNAMFYFRITKTPFLSEIS